MPFRFSDIPGVTPGRNAETRDQGMGPLFLQQSAINAQWARAQMDDALQRAQLAENARQADATLDFQGWKRGLDNAEWSADYGQRERRADFEAKKWETEDADKMRAAAGEQLQKVARAFDTQDISQFRALTNPSLQPRGLNFGAPAALSAPSPPATQLEQPVSGPPAFSRLNPTGVTPPPATPASIPESAGQAASEMGQVSDKALAEIEAAVANNDPEAAKRAASAAGITLSTQTGSTLRGSMVREAPEAIATSARQEPKDPLGDADLVATFNGQEIGRFNFQQAREQRRAQFEAFAGGLGETLDDPLDRKAHEEASRLVAAQSLPYPEASKAYADLFSKLRSGYQSGINAQEVSSARNVGQSQRQSQLDSNQFSEGARFMQTRLDKQQGTKVVTGLQSLRKLVSALQKPEVRGNRIFLTLQGNKLWRSTDDAAVLQNEREQLRVSGLPGVEEYLAGKLGMEVTEQQYNATLDTARRLLAQKEEEAATIEAGLKQELDETEYPSEAYRKGAAAALSGMFRGSGLPGYSSPERGRGGQQRRPAAKDGASARAAANMSALDNPEE